MKVRIFNNGNGWYIFATNYKDKEDKAYMNVRFPLKDGPIFEASESGYESKDIDILEAKFDCYKGKIGMSVFKYLPILSKPDAPTNDAKPETKVEISQEELPFY